MMLNKVISGGQIGADLEALRVAHKLGLQTGGFAPAEFRTSAGKMPELGTKFHLQEIAPASLSAMYVQRSKKNIDLAEATLAFRLQESPGTDNSIRYCQTKKWGTTAKESRSPKRRVHRPCLVVRAIGEKQQKHVVASITSFLTTHRVRTLNVVGHRRVAGMPNYTNRISAILTQAFIDVTKSKAEE